MSKTTREGGNPGGNNQRPYEPTVAQIRAACLEIQRGWTPVEFSRRRGLKFNPRDISSVRAGLVTHRIACDVTDSGEVE